MQEEFTMACETLHYSIFFVFLLDLTSLLLYIFGFVFNIWPFLLYMFRLSSIFYDLYSISVYFYCIFFVYIVYSVIFIVYFWICV